MKNRNYVRPKRWIGILVLSTLFANGTQLTTLRAAAEEIISTGTEYTESEEKADSTENRNNTETSGNTNTAENPSDDNGGITVTPSPDSESGGNEAEPTPDLSEDSKPVPTPDGSEGAEPTASPESVTEPTPTERPADPTPTEPTPAEPTPVEPTPTEPTPTEPGPEETVPTEPAAPTEAPTPTIKPAYQLPTENDEARYQYLLGTEVVYYTIDNPPPGYENDEAAKQHMKTITVPVWQIDSEGEKVPASFKLTINEKLAKNTKAIFNEIYKLDIQFPIRVLKGYGYRKVGGVGLTQSTLLSVHALGAAIDINPWDNDNDYFLGKGNDLRDKSNPYCIPDEVIEIFERYGWFWGGNFEICADTMHFQYLGLDCLSYQDNFPFRTLKVKSDNLRGSDVYNLQQRLCKLGFHVSVDGVYGKRTAAAIKKYQKSRGLTANGIVEYKTWETIINETHDMPYAF